jgi:hypothetical protein
MVAPARPRWCDEMPGPLTRLSLLPYLQSFDGSHLHVRLLLLPGGSPLDPLAGPATPSFATANLALAVTLTSGLADMPPAGVETVTVEASPAPAQAAALFGDLASAFAIDPTPPAASPRRAMTVLKHLPPSYLDASGVARPRKPFLRIDDSYACAHSQVGTVKPLPDRAAPIPWGRVIAIALRQPLLAEALGLVRPLTVVVPPGTFDHGGWLHVTLDPSGDAGLLVQPGALSVFSSRIGPGTGRRLFSPVLFPVPPGGAAVYDEPFAEALDYADGFAKIVHAAQQRTADPHAEADDGTRPARETGLRLGWDDEQVATWINRQAQVLGPTDPDTTMGVGGYRIDARVHGEADWHSLCAATGPVTVGATDIGVWRGDVPVETAPAQLNADAVGEYWLGAYFTRWTGGSIVGGDPVGTQLSGGPAPAANRVRPSNPGVPLRYGTTYDLRVRLADHTGGGPASTDAPAVPGLAPVATIPFRRWVRPARLTVEQPAAADADHVVVRRPRLTYPAYPCTGAPNAVDELLTDIAAAKAERREPSLPDPDVDTVQVHVFVRTLAFDPQADAGYLLLYSASRPFPADARQPLTLALDWQDVHDAATLVDPGAGALPVPTSRDVRLEMRAVGRADPHLAYFGAQDVRIGPPADVQVRRVDSDERDLLVVGGPADVVRGLYLQADPADDPTLAAATQAAGQAGQPGDSVARVAAVLDLDHTGLTLRARPGRRLAVGVAAGLRHSLGPDHGSVTVTSRSELTRQWLVAVHARIDRDWTWNGLSGAGVTVTRDGTQVGEVQLVPTLPAEGQAEGADRTATELLFVDVVDTRPAVGAFPRPVTVTYELHAQWKAPPVLDDDPLITQAITLPVTTVPAQVPRLVAAGVALSPYTHDEAYASTGRRTRRLWLQLDRPPDDPNDAYFCRVLRAAPDPLITGANDALVPDQPVEPPLPTDPEYTRVVVPGQSDDRAGAGAMQRLIPGDEPGYYLLPLPPGVHEDDPVLLGFWTYELRVGHDGQWSTAQGRFGNALHVASVQHPAPALPCTVVRYPIGVVASASYATPVYDGASLRPPWPATSIWMLLYTQVERADRGARRNVLLGSRLATPDRSRGNIEGGLRGAQLSGNAAWSQAEVSTLLESLGLAHETPLSVLAVEILPNEQPAADPLGSDLGSERILRTSPLLAVPDVCRP